LLRCLGKNFSFLCTLVGIYLVERKGNIRHGTAIFYCCSRHLRRGNMAPVASCSWRSGDGPAARARPGRPGRGTWATPRHARSAQRVDRGGSESDQDSESEQRLARAAVLLTERASADLPSPSSRSQASQNQPTATAPASNPGAAARKLLAPAPVIMLFRCCLVYRALSPSFFWVCARKGGKKRATNGGKRASVSTWTSNST